MEPISRDVEVRGISEPRKQGVSWQVRVVILVRLALCIEVWMPMPQGGVRMRLRLRAPNLHAAYRLSCAAETGARGWQRRLACA